MSVTPHDFQKPENGKRKKKQKETKKRAGMFHRWRWNTGKSMKLRRARP